VADLADKLSENDAPWLMHEFFAGSGLVACGLKGVFRPVWAIDNSEKKAQVYMANLPHSHFVLDDVRNIHGSSLPFAHLSWASFPCQDLSLAGSMGGIEANRSGLVWEWLRIIGELKEKPAVLLLENVAGLLSAKNGEHFKKLYYALQEAGYKCGAVLLDAAHFLPQSRPRVFVAALKQDVPIPPELVSDGPNWLHNKAAASLGMELPGWIWWSVPKPEPNPIKLSDMVDLSLPYDRDNALRLISPKHKAVLDDMKDALVTGYRRTRNGKQCLELRFDGLAGCLRTPEGGSSKQLLIVKRDGETHARVLTAREAARLMGAPDSFVLPKGENDGYKAMGDAVAAPAARFIGENLLSKLAEAAYAKL
jgi:DNA (cytosine-5)-methyltransferase 1